MHHPGLAVLLRATMRWDRCLIRHKVRQHMKKTSGSQANPLDFLLFVLRALTFLSDAPCVRRVSAGVKS